MDCSNICKNWVCVPQRKFRLLGWKEKYHSFIVGHKEEKTHHRLHKKDMTHFVKVWVGAK